MLQSDFHSVLAANDRESFRASVVKVAERLGFSTVSAVAVVDKGKDSEFVHVSNVPAAYVATHTNADHSRRDPILRHLKSHSVPILWNQQTFVRSGAADLWEEQAPYGFHTGIAMALHLPEGKHFMLGVDRDRALPSDRHELTRVVADLQLFAVHALDAALRVLVPAASSPDAPSLTPRELEALRWTMEGKTAWEVGSILGITERTAVLHVNNAMRKLGCVNKHQAVLKALRLGLIR